MARRPPRTIELPTTPQTQANTGNVLDYYDHENLVRKVVNAYGPLVAAFSTKPGGSLKPDGSEDMFSFVLPPVEGEEGAYMLDISPAMLEAIQESEAFYFDLWEFDEESPSRAPEKVYAATCERRPAIKWGKNPFAPPPRPEPTLISAATISGIPQVGVQLTAPYSTFNEADSVVREWLLDGAVIVGETGTTYTPIASDAGLNLRVRDTPYQDSVAFTPVMSDPVGPIQEAPAPVDDWDISAGAVSNWPAVPAPSAATGYAIFGA